MVHMQDAVHIAASVEQVFDFVTDFSNTPRWHEHMKKVGFREAGAPGVGSEYDWVETFMGKTMDLAGVITAWNPPNGFAWKPLAGPYAMSGGWSFEADGSQTKVTRFSDTELSGVMKLMARLMEPIARRQVRRELTKLKALIEGTAAMDREQ